MLVGVAVVVVPFVVVLAAVAGRSWAPTSDVALEMLQIDEVGTRHTPTTGAWSRWGWNHPGPLLYFVLAPFTWVFGNVGALIGVAVVNAAAVIASVLLARRRGGDRLAALVGLVVVLLCTALEPELWINPWNPWVGLLPMLCYMLLVWSIAERDVALLPYLVGVGTFIVQAHAGFAPVIVGVGLTGAVLAWRPRRLVSQKVVPPPGLVRSLVIALIVGIVLWLPPMIGELTRDPGNLSLLFDFVRDPPEAAAGWHVAWRVMTAEIGVPGAWMTGNELDLVDLDPQPLPAIMVLTVAAVLGSIAAWRGHRSAGRLAALSIISTLIGLFATSRVLGPTYDYIMRWWWIIGATIWLSIGWSTLSMIKTSRFQPSIVRGLIAVTAVVSLVAAGRATSVELPTQQDSDAVGALGAQLTDSLDPDTNYHVGWADRQSWGGVGVGVFVYLHQHGFDVRVPPEYVENDELDSWHVQETGTGSEVIRVVGHDDLAAGVRPQPGAVRVASHDPLSPGDRREADRLWAKAQSELDPSSDLRLAEFDSDRGRQKLVDAGVDPQTVEELAALRAQGPAYDVYLVEY